MEVINIADIFLFLEDCITYCIMTITTDDGVGSLEDNAAKRKERLAALKRKLQGQKTGGDGDDDSNQAGGEEETLPAPVFRSYKPLAPELQENAFDVADPTLIEDKIQVQIALSGFIILFVIFCDQDSLAAAEETTMIEELDIVNLAPRKPDWDLKRDIAKKLEKLEKRTARAIGEIIRERLKADTEEDLASAVQAGASYAAQSAEDDES